MKKTITLSGLLLCLFIAGTTSAITVDGNAYLENQTNHDSIKVVFERTVPSSLTYTVYTNSSGYYTADIETGVYDITYSKDDYFNELLTGQAYYSNITLSDITLLEHTTILNVPSMFTTIQGAINRAYENDTVLVDTGTYIENINFNGKNITVASLFFTTQDTSYISQTVIDGDSLDSVIKFENGEDSTAVLSGFTITNGAASNGGGINYFFSSPTLENVTIIGNNSVQHGGGICFYESSPSLENVTIIGNNVDYYGGGIFCEFNSSPSLVNVTISSNSSGGHGGGVSLSGSSSSLVNVTIAGNSSGGDGGGIYMSTSSPSLENVTIIGNNAVHRGSGIFCGYDSDPSLENVTIAGNSSGGDGGGIYLWEISPSLENVTIIGNSAEYGGGIYCKNSSPILENVTIIGNSASLGGGICFYSFCSPSLVNSVISDNTGNYGVYNDTNNLGNPSITYSDFYNNENGNFYNCGQWIGVNVTTNVNGDSCDAYYNIQLDPCFVDTANGDYHLTIDSPCIDAGDPTSPLDPDGTIADMGAYYFEQVMTVNPTELDFGDVLIGNDSTLSVTLNNYSDSVITIYDVFCSDTVFATNWTESTIPGGDSLVIDVTFTPNTTGNKTGILTIENSYIDKNVSLSGNGLGAYILPDLYSLNFGAIEPGYPDTLLLEITNNGGNINLEISTIIDAPSNYFYFVSITDSTILPNSTSILKVEFDPQEFGLFSDTLYIISNAYNEDTLKISLSGEGGLIPASVENLTINVDSVDAVLNWSPVTATINGNPLTVNAYLVYYCGSPDSVFYFHGLTTDTTYTHYYVAQFCNDMFYQVTAYAGDLGKLMEVISEHPHLMFGELNVFLENYKNQESLLKQEK